VTVRTSALSQLTAVLARWLGTASEEKRSIARTDRLNGHLMKDVGLTREKEALKHWRDFM